MPLRKPTYLELRGAQALVTNALQSVHWHPWEPGWSYPEIGKYGHAQSVDDAIYILENALFKLNAELTL